MLLAELFDIFQETLPWYASERILEDGAELLILRDIENIGPVNTNLLLMLRRFHVVDLFVGHIWIVQGN